MALVRICTFVAHYCTSSIVLSLYLYLSFPFSLPSPPLPRLPLMWVMTSPPTTWWACSVDWPSTTTWWWTSPSPWHCTRCCWGGENHPPLSFPPPPPTPPLPSSLLCRQPDLSDLAELKPSVGHSLQKLLAYGGERIEEDFGLTFEITRRVFGDVVNHSLVPGGASIPVTMDNRWAGPGRWMVSQRLHTLRSSCRLYCPV